MNDLSFIDYLHWTFELARHKMMRTSKRVDQEIARYEDMLDLWLSLAERITGQPRWSDSPFWSFVRRADHAGIGALSLIDEAPNVTALLARITAHTSPVEEDQLEAYDVSSALGQADDEVPEPPAKPSPFTPDERETLLALKDRILNDPVWAMETFQVVELVGGTKAGKEYAPFILNEYQRQAYLPWLMSFIRGEHPIGAPSDDTWIKPRQVGSTEFWKQLVAYLMQTRHGYRVLLHFPLEDDAKVHMRKIYEQLDRMAFRWPNIFYKVSKKNDDEGIIELDNGSQLTIRYVKSSTKGLGGNYDLVIMSEAGKYEREKPNAWNDINQVIMPAVHEGPLKARVRESTNDELAREIQRIKALSDRSPEYYRVHFYPWTIVPSYVAYSVKDPVTDPEGLYHDYRIVDGERLNISEFEYCAQYNLSPKQIGFRRIKIDALGSLDLYHREYPMTYEESAHANSVGFWGIDPTALPTFRDPIAKFNIDIVRPSGPHTIKDCTIQMSKSPTGRVFVFEFPVAGMEYALAADFSDGIPDGDYTNISMHRVDNGYQVAAARFRGGSRNDIEIADLMACMVIMYGRRVYVNGEMNNVGKSVRSRWIDYGHGFDYMRPLERESFDVTTDAMWFQQNSATRERAILAFRTALVSGEISFCDVRFGYDADDFIKTEAGRYEAAEGVSKHTGEKIRDDYVMCGAIAWETIRKHPRRRQFTMPAKVAKATGYQGVAPPRAIADEMRYNQFPVLKRVIG